jgi:hypothetical protein
LIFTGGIGLILRIPVIITLSFGYYYFGLLDALVGLLTILIVIGSTSIELPSTPFYWIPLVVLLSISFILVLLGTTIVNMYYSLFLVCRIGALIFAILVGSQQMVFPKYGDMQEESDDPFKYLD